MAATLFLSTSTFPLFSTSLPEPFTSLPFSSPIFFKTPKPLNSLSSNSTSFPLQNRSFSTNTKKDSNFNNNNDNVDGKGKDSDESAKVKMPTAPWMKGPLILQPDEIIDMSKPRNKKGSSNKDSNKVDRALTEKVSGRRGKKAMKKIVERIEKLQFGSGLVDAQRNWDDTQKNWDDSQENWDDAQKNWGGLGGAQRSWDGAQKNWDNTQKNWDDLDDAQRNWDGTQKNWGDSRGGFLLGQVGVDGHGGGSRPGRRMPWESRERMVFRRVKKEKVVTAAELSLDKELLERLRGVASKMRKWVKVNKAGVTQAVVDEVHSIWAGNELAMLKFGLPLCKNMDRAREIVEIKTGGLVVWSRKDILVAYRGCSYQETGQSEKNYQRMGNKFSSPKQGFEAENMDGENDCLSPLTLIGKDLETDSTTRSLYEREGDRLLDGLGPRFVDWWYPKPLPVDGDLLPEVVPGFKPPFRLCPPHVRPQLTDDELTHLRKLARPLPVHFVLGRNSKLQGLAVAILKLWEKSIIAKIAIKWGVQNTNNELMASELKRLTGGVLLLRNKFFIIFYRGKDFLPGNVASKVVEREMELNHLQLYEEDARLKAAGTLDLSAETEAADTTMSVVGTFSEFQHIQSTSGNVNHFNHEAQVKLEAEKERLEKDLRKQEHKLAILRSKIEKAEKELYKLNSSWEPSEGELDQELMTEEERECLRKIGLKMDRVLVLGRRGVFDGVIEGLHQHWKHRELVKVISMQKTFMQIVSTARLLERESGGILVSVDKLKKGHAIMIYRGKNYKRPIEFGRHLLDKRKALKRSLEMQRVGSLRFFAHQREKEIADLKLKLVELKKKSGKSV